MFRFRRKFVSIDVNIFIQPHARVLGALMSAMDTLNYSLRAKLAVSVALTRAMVKPQVQINDARKQKKRIFASFK